MKFRIVFITRHGWLVRASSNSSTDLLEIAGTGRILTLTKSLIIEQV